MSLHPIEAKLAAAWPPQTWQDVTVLLAVSGGADSVALLRAMTALKTDGEGRLAVAHFNHHLREDESAADEAFVGDLCRRLEIPCEVGHGRPDELTGCGGDGLEAAARTVRYEFLAATAARLGARYVVTAHTADDQAETILHRIIRGTGIGGLRGMARARLLRLPFLEMDEAEEASDEPADRAATLPPATTTLIRPLLEMRRSELVAYLDDLGQPYRSDSSNADVRFTRNRIRHELLPRLAEQFNSAVVDALLRLGTLADEAQAAVDWMVDDLIQRCVTVKDAGAIVIDGRPMTELPRYLVRELLIAVWRRRTWPMQAMGFAQWDQLAEMLINCCKTESSSAGKQMFPGSILAEAARGQLCLSRVEQ
ncbi:MAG TPA: tRNA lysidine(34) synthetase TilS [Thermoguttaceae bacterium]|nr:tRNA lysidine(34) synthetase TilS [Thermoguttaceae bacterium]